MADVFVIPADAVVVFFSLAPLFHVRTCAFSVAWKKERIHISIRNPIKCQPQVGKLEPLLGTSNVYAGFQQERVKEANIGERLWIYPPVLKIN